MNAFWDADEDEVSFKEDSGAWCNEEDDECGANEAGPLDEDGKIEAGADDEGGKIEAGAEDEDGAPETGAVAENMADVGFDVLAG